MPTLCLGDVVQYVLVPTAIKNEMAEVISASLEARYQPTVKKSCDSVLVVGLIPAHYQGGDPFIRWNALDV